MDNKFGVTDTTRFESDNYPDLREELAALNKNIRHMPVYYKGDIVVSFLSDHSLMNHWIDANPELVRFITSGSVRAPQTELLFEACRENKAFRQSLGAHIRRQVLSPRD